jgi:hypothetical protein
MPNKGTFTPVLADPDGVLAAACANVSAKLRPDSPTFSLTVSNPVVPELWEDENGGLIQDGDGEGIELE